MGILPLKERVNRIKCSLTTKQRMFGVFAINEILRYRWTPFVGSRTLCHPGPRQFSHLPTSEITFEIPGENYLWHHFDVDFTALSGLLTCDLSKRAQLCLGQNMIRWQAKSLPRRKRLWKMWTNWRFRRRFQIQIVRSHHRRLQIDGLDTSHLQNSDRKWRRGIPPENWHQKPVKLL